MRYRFEERLKIRTNMDARGVQAFLVAHTLTLKKAAKRLRWSPKELEQEIKAGRMDAIKVGDGSWRVLAKDVEWRLKVKYDLSVFHDPTFQKTGS